MKDMQAKKERFLRDSISIRLGGMAANLARIKSFSNNSANESAVFDLFEETKYFIEWTANETEINTASELAELQLQIAIWQRNWESNWSSSENRKVVASRSAAWSRKLLERSGLLDR